MKLEFEVIPNKLGPPASGCMLALLHEDNWDDWGKYSTMYYFRVFDANGELHDIGRLKIGQFRMNSRRPEIPEKFTQLCDQFFSLGQDASFYQNLYALDYGLRGQVLRALNDVVNDQQLFSRILTEEVAKISLLRSVSPTSIQGQFRRVLQGSARLTAFKFKYLLPKGQGVAGVTVDFNVKPESNPPSNIHVLIGRNGVGKTHLLNNMVRALVDKEAKSSKVGSFFSMNDDNGEGIFSGVISISFSAFDPFEPLPEQRDKTAGIKYSYVGLKRTSNRGGDQGTPMSHDMLANEFVKSLMHCLKMGKKNEWQKALSILETDQLFNDAALRSLIDTEDDDVLKKTASSLFKKLSSGHGIVLLTLTRLVQTVEEKSLVLLDEPEAHLHPPLLSAFVRALSDILSHKNGLAIIATHSPIVAQEVPSQCVWKMRRTGYEAVTERPSIETFGENVGVLTREIFGLEVTQSGFHQLLQFAIAESNNFGEVMEYFEGKLGAEARAISRGLIAEREHREDDNS
ncbi:MAG: AAA family ATPase [Methylococcaceae bacterium]|nr:AAA family ATPase [Methylococcaceae bacterium]MDZ4217559.1 AAA family ATPase [Methylobacter sp.]MDP2395002.1 AAA family ATPase [Methylococcaceae bacterium]MDP3020501.1 AAA family ATPase [Methylococcaceae bacterium]MDP3389864.1 AAA family ATPase [Methylococcaceae bacterium]